MKGRVLGFDYGTRRIGVAVGNQATNTTQPLKTVSAKNGKPTWREIDELVSEWRPANLVVGLPLDLDGSHGAAADAACKFGEALSTRYELPIVMVDERLTSAESDAILKENASPGKTLSKKRHALRDSIAAELIIRTYLTDNPAPR